MNNELHIPKKEIPAMGKVNFTGYYVEGEVKIGDISTNAHIHPHYEMYLYIEGDISFVVNNSIYHLSPGDVIFTRPNTYHHSVVFGKCIHKHCCLFFNTEDLNITEMFDKIAEKGKLAFKDENDKETMIELIKKISINENDIFSEISDFYKILSLLGNLTEIKSVSECPPILKEILRYIGENYSSLQNIGEIADKFFISQSTVERLFRQYMKITPYKYITETKMAGACRCLEEGKSVTYSAMANGFSDCSKFIIYFKRRFGITPNQYKKNMRNFKGYALCKYERL